MEHIASLEGSEARRESSAESWSPLSGRPFEIVGPADAPVVVALGGISATRHVTSHPQEPAPGWWESVVGERRGIDTCRFRVLSFDYLDGGRGPDGRPARLITTHAQADALAGILDVLRVPKVHAIAGASYGGMVALAFAERYPNRVERLVVISAPHEPHPMSTALRVVQRRVVEMGLASGRAAEALALARALAVTTYRSAREFGERFDSRPIQCGGHDARFPVEDYLRHQGERFVSRCSPERFLALSLSLDLHHVDPSRIHTPATLIAAEGDTIVPLAQMEQLAARISAPSQLTQIPTLFGHDAFLTEPDLLRPILHTALTSPILQ